jgi:alpha-beta hydrolase superfamily lysophospholipase
MRIVWLIISVYALVIVAAWLLQYRMLYFPDRISLDDVRRQAAAADLVIWAPGDGDYRGLRREPKGACRGTILVFHGNAGSAVDRSYYADALVPLGYRVVLVEYPAYGGRPGRLGEASFAADARTAVRMALKQFGGPLFLWGESLGCGVAATAASDAVKGIVLLTPWDSLTNVARSLYRFLPVRLLLRDRYNTAANLAGFHGPVAVVMAGRDEVIPNRFTKKLYESLASPKRMWLFKEAGHNSWPSTPGLTWWREVMAFVDTP